MDFLRLLEGIRTPWLDKIMLVITALGSEAVFLAIALTLIWCVDKKKGYYALTVCFVGTIINQFLKIVCKVPRPWVRDASFGAVEAAKADASGYSFPSGHTQNITGLFGSLFFDTKNKAMRIISVIIIILVSFSRMYLGVHTPADVLTSLGIGLVLVIGIGYFMRLCDKKKNLFYYAVIFMALISLAFAIFSVTFNFGANVDAHNLFECRKNAFTLLGAILALCVMYPIEEKYVRFETKASLPVQLLKLIPGLAIVVLIKSLLKSPLAALLGTNPVQHTIRYFIIVIFAGLVWPLTFKYFNRIKFKSSK